MLVVAAFGSFAVGGNGCGGTGGAAPDAGCMWNAPRPGGSPCGGATCGAGDCQSGVCGTQAGVTGHGYICCQSNVPQGLGAPCVCDSDCAPETPEALADLGNAIECSFGKCSCKPGAVSASCPGDDGGSADAGSDAHSGGGSEDDAGNDDGAAADDAGAGWCCCEMPPAGDYGNTCQCLYVTYGVASFCTESFCNAVNPANNNYVASTCSEPCCYVDNTPGSQTIGSCLCVDQATWTNLGFDSCSDYVLDCYTAGTCNDPDNTMVASCPSGDTSP